ncbi:MAG: hypothetical protein JSW00_05495 [Thermoplasmata archaeon]|nr:MAG: hypothetical protein JSW00_05495 [Thermoplasmata archaeon]
MKAEMEKKISATILGLLILSIGIPILTTQNIESKTVNTNIQETLEMLIFISPQYADDKEIKDTINYYTKAVKDDLGWNTKIITINQENNDYKKIDQTIEQHYTTNQIKACIMVGEDIDTALAGDTDYMEKPSTMPWSTIGGETAYDTSKKGIVSKPYTNDICISLLYPTHTLGYQTKKSQIIYAFTKFSNQRTSYLEDIYVCESSDINKNSKELYQQLNNYGNLYYYEDPSEIKTSLNQAYSIYLVHGHSNPSGTDINKTGWFSADNVDQLDAPFFGADGCYVNGWWSNQTDNNILDPSIDGTWYGSKIFTSKNVKAMALGLLAQNGFQYPVSFIENALPDLVDGKTLAESIIGDIYVDNTIIIGDPTFHYSPLIIT